MFGVLTAISAIIAFVVTFLSGYIIIPLMHKLKYGQTILEIGPKWHKNKQGTPTMGGIMFIIGIAISLLTTMPLINLIGPAELKTQLGEMRQIVSLVAGLALAVSMSLIGFIDDYIKVVKKQNLGLTAKQKTLMQLLVSAAYLTSMYLSGMTYTKIPFIGNVDLDRGIGLLFWPIALMFVYGFTNAVNLTDGIDGLASSVTLVVACAFMLGSGFLNSMNINAMSAALAGACVGFIFWNAKPAKVFMGDTGSMFLGGMVVAVSFGIGRPILLIFAGITYLLEALSDIIQVAYYKRTKKRIFKMAPLHHHFEMCGWSEQKIVYVFSGVTAVGCAVALLPIIFNW